MLIRDGTGMPSDLSMQVLRHDFHTGTNAMPDPATPQPRMRQSTPLSVFSLQL